MPILLVLGPGIPAQTRNIVALARQLEVRHLLLGESELHVEAEGRADEQSREIDELGEILAARHEADELLVADWTNADAEAALNVPDALADDRVLAELGKGSFGQRPRRQRRELVGRQPCPTAVKLLHAHRA